MNVKKTLVAVALSVCFLTSYSQRVVRKGVKPIELNKNAGKTPKTTFTLEQLQGKWQEYKRSGVDSGSAAGFTDTLMLKITQGNAEVKEGMSLNMKGEAAIEAPDQLEVAGDSYTILSVTADNLTLNDGESVKSLKKVKYFYLETVGKDSVTQPVYTVPGVNVSMTSIKGKWTIYRREAKPGTTITGTELIKSISVLRDSTDKIAFGELYYTATTFLRS